MADNEGMNQASELTFTIKNTGDLAAGMIFILKKHQQVRSLKQ